MPIKTRRKSVYVEGYTHGDNPIPAACRIGNMVMTGGVFGLDTGSGKLPEDPIEQVRLTFINLEKIVNASGGSLGDIIRMTFHVRNPEIRAVINREWEKAFPDPDSRPARHTLRNDLLAEGMALVCDAIAVVADYPSEGKG